MHKPLQKCSCAFGEKLEKNNYVKLVGDSKCAEIFKDIFGAYLKLTHSPKLSTFGVVPPRKVVLHFQHYF